MTRTAHTTIRLAIVLQGGIVRCVGYDTDGKPVRIEAQVMDYDCPRGGVIAGIPQSDGTSAEAMVYPADLRFIPEQIAAAFEASVGAQIQREAEDGRKSARRRAARPKPLPAVPDADCDLPLEYAEYMAAAEDATGTRG